MGPVLALVDGAGAVFLSVSIEMGGYVKAKLTHKSGQSPTASLQVSALAGGAYWLACNVVLYASEANLVESNRTGAQTCDLAELARTRARTWRSHVVAFRSCTLGDPRWQ